MPTKTPRPAPAPAAAPAAPWELPPHAGNAQNVWLAGLGALASAQAEGSKAFEALVKQGLDMQSRTQQLARERMEAMTGNSAAPWDRLGGIFEERVARALASMGMPSASEVAQLKARVEALEAALATLQGAAPASPQAPRAAARRQSAAKP